MERFTNLRVILAQGTGGSSPQTWNNLSIFIGCPFHIPFQCTMNKIPNVRKLSTGYCVFKATEEAEEVARRNVHKGWTHALPQDNVHANAQRAAREQGIQDPDRFTLRGLYELQLGKYRGQTFHWLLENDVGYATFLICKMEDEGGNTGDTPLNKNKHELKTYMQSFPDGRAALAQKRKSIDFRNMALEAERKRKTAAALLKSTLPTAEVARRLQKTAQHTKLPVPKVSATATVSKPPTEEMGDQELLQEVKTFESSQTAVPASQPKPAPQTEAAAGTSEARPSLAELRQEVKLGGKLQPADPHPLPRGWKSNLPPVDHSWVSKALVRHNAQGRLEVRPTQLWYYPPQASLNPHGIPGVDRYFAHPLLVWMPRRLWAVKVSCVVCRRELVAAGPHDVVREVLNLTGFYYAVTEELQCKSCNKRYLGWSQSVLNQLDVAHRNLFSAVLTYKYACDVTVVTLLRTRGQGNSANQLRRKLEEEHSQEWMTKTLHYLADCQSVFDSKVVARQAVHDPPRRVPVPQAAWLQTVYCHDIMGRVDDIKAAITSTFGRILKMDSTKKVAKKLAGQSRGTASWASNVGNEKGQVLMSVLTSREGYGLASMVDGIVDRYDRAAEDPPQVLYVDRDCCGDSEIHRMFHAWPLMKVRLDIWHFMRRFSAGCSTDAHILYPLFMSRLSKAIFEWSSEDLEKLKEAKTAELMQRQVERPSSEDICHWLTKRELALYCRRRTRGVEETTRLIGELMEAFMGDQGRDTSGVALFDNEVMTAIWDRQKRHIGCIQDPEGISLYTVTGTSKKGGTVLCRYRCARGSVSLESFHNHLAKFIPGTTASDAHFQAYLLDGLMRWNEDREKEATGGSNYSGQLQHSVNRLSYALLDRKLIPDFRPPRAYTGEKIGLEYLYGQNHMELQAVTLDPEDAASARDAVGPDNLPGYGLVDQLADYLHSLRDQDLALTDDQAAHIIRLWGMLTDFDKQPTTPRARHRTRITKVSTATYKKKGAQSVVPGVDAVNRTMRGDSEGPAQRPDANRIMASLVIKLCGSHPSPEKRAGQRIERWSLITRAYRNIRRLVVEQPRVVAETGLQLFNINNATLTKWYNDRVKAQELAILGQGFTLREPPMAASTGNFPAPTQRVPVGELAPIPPGQEHSFSVRRSLLGAATVRKRVLMPKPPTAARETPPNPDSLYDRQPLPTPVPFAATADSLPSIARSTQWYHNQIFKKKLEGQYVKEYTRQRAQRTYTCRKCGELRNAPSHTQYYGSWYCAKTALTYMQSFPDGRAALAQKRKSIDFRNMALEAERKRKTAAALLKSTLPTAEVARRLQKTAQHTKLPVPKVSATATVSKPPTEEMGDQELLQEVKTFESSQTAVPASQPKPAPQTEAAAGTSEARPSLAELRQEVKLGGKLQPADPHPLPRGWKSNLPPVDHSWVSKALVRHNAQGRLEVRPTQLWYYPPQASLNPHGIPGVDRYFAHPLLVWMPRRLWAVKVSCVVCRRELVAAGPHDVVREVLNLTGFYYAVTEELQCKSCNKRYLGWSQSVLNQLDVAHRNLFSAVLTYKYACDVTVVTLLRTRGQGNSANQLRRKLEEEHSQEWMTKTLHYLADCQSVFDSKVVARQAVHDPPRRVPVPQAAWLQTVYCHDIMGRVDDIKAAITSTFGRILKMDSTKKVAKKLAGQSRGTASWASNVGNEKGQVLMSVLTSREGYGLASMVDGIVDRYDRAAEDPPQVLYVDRDCCGDSEIHRMFHAWPLMKVRLDIWHFMRRFSAGCSTDAHILYPLFMSRLSKAIFEWSSEDLEKLKEAKTAELMQRQVERPSSEDICHWLTKRELALYCRRRTRGVEETTRLIGELMEAFMGDQGRDTSGVALFDNEVMTAIWDRQKRHIGCIQDPEGISLYTVTGTSKKGGTVLCRYRCARGSVSLESFHNHLAKFIPGTTASDAHFQAYLLDGLMRWNEDREKEATGGSNYSGQLQHSVNRLSYALLDRKLIPDFRPPRAYTGEKIGLEYLYGQNHMELQAVTLDPEDAASARVEPEPGAISMDDEAEDEGFQEEEDPTQPPVDEEQLRSDPAAAPFRRPPAPTRILTPPQPQPLQVPVPPPPPAPVPVQPPSGDQQPGQSDPTDAVGPDNLPGYGLVDQLADYLHSLRDQDLALTDDQAAHIIRLWGMLTDFDKQPTTPRARHRTRITKVSTATYKKKGAQSVVPGVDAVNRTMRGDSEGPAQRPDANRIMASLVIKLCGSHPSPEKRAGQRIERWSLITRAYRNIRRLVVEQPRVVAETGLQLFNINNATLTKWYNDRVKAQELAILGQGFTLREPPMAASTGNFPAPTQRVPVGELAPIPPGQEHSFSVRRSLLGAATVRKRVLMPKPPTAARETPPNPDSLYDRQPLPTPVPFAATADSLPSIARSTQWYHNQIFKKKLEGQYVKEYTRQRAQRTYTCRKCGELRNAPSHTQYYGSWYCAKTALVTPEEWRSSQVIQRLAKKQRRQEQQQQQQQQ
ncbi:hypothetical protein MAR_026724, partial [Mya arenaria]